MSMNATDCRASLSVQIRWLIARDLPAVLRIENECFEYPWTEKDFVDVLRQHNHIGMVAEHNHQIVGYMVYELHKARLDVLNFGVYPLAQRQGVGSQLIEKLIGKLSPQRRSIIDLHVRESNLPAQLFFREQGFRCVKVIKNAYDDTAEDAYVMRYLV